MGKTIFLTTVLFFFMSLSIYAQNANVSYSHNHSSYNIWNGGYDKSDFEVVIGYVNKSWRCTYSTTSQREDFFGDPDDKYFHGMQMGALYTPSFDWGLGLRTGLFLEVYYSRSKWITDFCDRFSELDLYIPLHASYRIPFTNDIGMNILGGFGFQWAIDGSYDRYIGTGWSWRRPYYRYESRRHTYGNGWPEKVNWQAEVGLNFRIKMISVGFIYSFGLNEHGIENTFDGGKTYVKSIKSRQDKMQASIAFVF